MRRISRLSRSRSASRRAIIVLGASLAVWAVAGLLLTRILRETGFSPFGTDEQTSFDDAFQSITELEDNAPPLAIEPSKYGISQAIYDAWRLNRGKPAQSVMDLSPEEARDIYQDYWFLGECDRYAAPLDIACLDSVISFGVERGKQFLVGLPEDPQAAALEVAQRREAFRRSAINYAHVPVARQLLTEGLKRDRALAALVQSYTASEQEQVSFDLREWLGLDQGLNTQGDSEGKFSDKTESHPDAALLNPDEIYTQAKPFTVEVWINTNGTVAPAAGVLLTADGLVLTNYHVVNALDGVAFEFVRLADGQEFNGKIIEVVPDLDLAFIQLEGASGLPTAILADDSSHVQVGDTVYAIGSPQGEHWKMTTAQVIQVQSDCGLASLRCIRTPKGFLRPGNSGGPLLDGYGQVIGINRAVQQRTGEGVSIPVETVKQLMAELEESK